MPGKVPLAYVILSLLCAIRQAACQSAPAGSCNRPSGGATGATPTSQSPTSQPELTNIILIGGTGDLAQKYIWPALFDIYRRRSADHRQHMQIYVCGRTPADRGRQRLAEILLHRLDCGGLAGGDAAACRDAKTAFVATTHYHRLRDDTSADDDFARLGAEITDNTRSRYGLADSGRSYETGRLVYVATPPSAHARLAKRLAEHIRPRVGGAWMRVVFEKPLGRDFESARDLTTSLRQWFSDDELYLVDHYLCKAAVRQILSFRSMNEKQYGPLWNRDHVERVEVVLGETVDVRGRTEFYDDVGVLRDVMQSHVTELLVLVAMQLPDRESRISDVLRLKRELLVRLRAARDGGVLTGQYASYAAECGNATDTPTYAAAVVYVDSARWRGVPFLLASGKKLASRSTYIRVVFRRDAFCPTGRDGTPCEDSRQIVFRLDDDAAEIVISGRLPEPVASRKWAWTTSSGGARRVALPGAPPAYSTLLTAVCDGRRDLFVGVDCLLASWRLWTAYLHAAPSPRPYDGGAAAPASLDARLVAGRLAFLHPPPAAWDAGRDAAPTRALPAHFLRRRLVSGDDVIPRLARDMRETAERAIARGGAFHVAVSGGTTPLALWRHVTAADDDDAFPWRQTHVWQVDERCVPPGDQQSNFASLDAALLQRAPLPYRHVHPIFVDSATDLCSDPKSADVRYADAIRQDLPEHRFDLVLLGLGSDGHTASLFAGAPESADRWVRLASAPLGGPMRVTMTSSLINMAAEVAVLVTGTEKAPIIAQLASVETASDDFPITLINPVNGTMTWYIDYSALFGSG